MDSKTEFPPAYNTNFDTNYGQPATQPYTNQQSAYNYTSAPVQQAQGQVGYNYSTAVVLSQPALGTVVASSVPDNLGLAIIATLFFWPIGLFAIMKANEVRTHLARGDVSAAMTSSADARRLSLIGIGVGILAIITIIIAVVVIQVNSTSVYYYG